MIDVIDYGAGNIGSILRCLERLGVDYQRVGGQRLPTGENPLLFPGVGAFGAAMTNLSQSGLAGHIYQLIKAGTPYLGICIGLQVLFEGSEEAPGVAGLGVVPGQVIRFQRDPESNGKKIPQIGWNWIQSVQPHWKSGYVYFVNAYYPKPEDSTCILYEADYQGSFTAAIRQDNITAFQFHPEKSGGFGQELIRSWLTDVYE